MALSKNEIVKFITSRKKGTYLNLKYTTKCVSTSVGPIRRVTDIVVRAGVNYGILDSTTKSTIAVKPLWGGKGVHDEENPFIVTHTGNKETYLQVYTTKCKYHTFKDYYIFDDGEESSEITDEKALGVLKSVKELQEHPEGSVFVVNIKNVIKLGK